MTDNDSPSCIAIVIEDEAGMNSLYEDWIRTSDANCLIESFTSGQSGLDHLSEDVDLLICDRVLPDVSGDSIIASLPETSFEGPVVVVSAVDESVPLGYYSDDPVPHDRVVAYLQKPVSRAAFLSAVFDALERDVS